MGNISLSLRGISYNPENWVKFQFYNTVFEGGIRGVGLWGAWGREGEGGGGGGGGGSEVMIFSVYSFFHILVSMIQAQTLHFIFSLLLNVYLNLWCLENRSFARSPP